MLTMGSESCQIATNPAKKKTGITSRCTRPLVADRPGFATVPEN